jgi:hypothetical protein
MFVQIVTTFLLLLVKATDMWKGQCLLYSGMISILEKATLFDMKRTRKSVYWHIIVSFVDMDNKYLWFFSFFRFILCAFCVTICSSSLLYEEKKKNHRREHTYAQRTTPRIPNRSFCTYRTQLLPRCMHAQGFNISLLLVRYALVRSLLSLRVYVCERFFYALFFSSSLRVAHETCCNHFFCRTLCAWPLLPVNDLYTIWRSNT